MKIKNQPIENLLRKILSNSRRKSHIIGYIRSRFTYSSIKNAIYSQKCYDCEKYFLSEIFLGDR